MKFKVTSGIFAGHEFTGDVQNGRVYEKGTGRSFPIQNCTAFVEIEMPSDIRRSYSSVSLLAGQGFRSKQIKPVFHFVGNTKDAAGQFQIIKNKAYYLLSNS